ncbi:hypothetical protein B7P43_G05903 [Cryptotermes secundus]|uniref:RGS domain-containing protein n=1 Tax=Cryptotermes secundus TaxID=105785 RepID=A0A2J7RIG2_9NEOP|nr:hypothetical protein B7P43_G05903 [Cryptotermes secundus]
MSVDSEQRSGRLSMSRNAYVIEKVRVIMEDRRLAIREVADEVGISRGSANTILTEDLGMRRVAAKFCPSCFRRSSNNSILRVSWSSMAFRVSLDSRVREIVNRNMIDPTPHTFDEAQLQIYTLMHRDSYPRFVNSSLFKQLAQLNNNGNNGGGGSAAGTPTATQTSGRKESNA